MYTGPNIIKDNLVFGYDTGYGVADNNTATRFYPGEPTTNLVTTNLETLGTDGSGQSSVGTRTTIAPNHVRIVDVVSNTRQTHLIQGLTAGATYTVSIQFKKLIGTPTFRFQLQDYSGTSYIRGIKFTSTAETGLLDIDGWQTAKWTFTLGSDANAVRIWWQDGADYVTYTHSFELKNPQLEVKGHSTPYINGTRSSTQSLLDLKTTSDINLSNVSFGSTGQPTFDGSDDYINIGSSAVLDVGSMTQEVIYQPLGINRRNPIIADNNPNGSDKAHAMWLEHYNDNKLITIFGDGSTHGDVSSTATITDTTKYHHIVCVRDATAKTMEYFINGVSDGVKDWANKSTIGTPVVYDGSTSALSYDHTIGGHSSFNKSYANIPVVKIYNRKLTSAEIKQNYNAYKNRFGL